MPSAAYAAFVNSMADGMLGPRTHFEKHPTLPKAAVARLGCGAQ